MRRLLAVIPGIALAACAGHLKVLPPSPFSEADLLSAHGLDVPLPPPAVSDDWLQLDADMRAFVARHAGPNSDHPNLHRIVRGLLDEKRMEFAYRADADFTASDTFRLRAGNCLSISAMMVSLLREAGFDAGFQRVQLPQDWYLEGSTVLTPLHINTVVRMGHGGVDVELDWVRNSEETRHYARQRISDREALADVHNNLGARAMLAGDMATAFAELQRALELAPHAAHAWANLGAWYHRRNDEEHAEAAWLTALRHNPREPGAIGGLHRLYLRTDRQELAEALDRELQRYHARNPYHHYFAAKQALDAEDYVTARARLKRAMALQEDERFEALLAAVNAHARSAARANW